MPKVSPEETAARLSGKPWKPHSAHLCYTFRVGPALLPQEECAEYVSAVASGSIHGGWLSPAEVVGARNSPSPLDHPGDLSPPLVPFFLRSGPDWPVTRCVDQADLKPRSPPASGLLGLQVCTIVPAWSTSLVLVFVFHQALVREPSKPVTTLHLPSLPVLFEDGSTSFIVP